MRMVIKLYSNKGKKYIVDSKECTEFGDDQFYAMLNQTTRGIYSLNRRIKNGEIEKIRVIFVYNNSIYKVIETDPQPIRIRFLMYYMDMFNSFAKVYAL